MARKNQHTFAKRQRELKKAEKLAEKQARREQRRHTEAEAADPDSEEGEPSAVPEEETPPE